MNEPLVSVCVPVYGVEKYIAKCAESVFEQTYGNLEVIFVDDCTKDRSIEVLQEVIGKHPERKEAVRIIRHERNRGLAAAREIAVAEARGKYLMHVDSDDYIEPETVEECVKVAEENDSDLVRFGMVQEFKHISRVFLPLVIEDKEAYLKMVIEKNKNVSHYVWGALYRTSLYKENDVHWLEAIDYGEDYSVFPRLIYYAKTITFIQKPFYHYIRFNESSYTAFYKQKYVDCIKAIYQYHKDFFFNKEEYSQSIRLVGMKNQAFIIRYVFSFSHNKEIELKEMNEVVYDRSVKLSLSHKIIIGLCVRKMYFALKIYVYTIRLIISLIRPYLKKP